MKLVVNWLLRDQLWLLPSAGYVFSEATLQIFGIVICRWFVTFAFNCISAEWQPSMRVIVLSSIPYVC